MTDYMLRLSNSTLVIIKHWRPIPKLGEPSIFVVAIDDSPASMRALEQVRACPRVRARPRAALETGRSPEMKEVALHESPRALLARRARTLEPFGGHRRCSTWPSRRIRSRASPSVTTMCPPLPPTLLPTTHPTVT